MYLGHKAPQALQQTPFDCDTLVEHITPEGRRTVVLLVLFRSSVLLVKPTRGDRFIIPQGGIDPALGDRTIGDTVFREGREELGLEKHHLVPGHERPRILGRCMNMLPPERGSGRKDFFFFSLYVSSDDWVRLNHENREYQWAKFPEVEKLFGTLVDGRETKRRASVEALHQTLIWQ